MKQYKMYINGQWVESEKSTTVRNPYNNDELGSLPQASMDQVDQAIEAAHKAKSVMAALPIYKRVEILEKTAEQILANKEKVTKSIIDEAGKAWKWASVETERAAENLKFAASECLQLKGETVPMDASKGSENRAGFWMRFPVGVVGAIPPFNFPLNLVVHKVAPAIAAGNSIVLKPASNTPGPSQLLVEYLLEAGLPETAINLVYGNGSTVGEAIVKDERVAKITFTGSPPVGRRIKQVSGLKKVTLELGSNAGTIIDENADLDLAVNRCLMGSFAYSGQVCISVQRIYIHKSIFKTFADRFAQKTGELQVGDPSEQSTDVGPMISEHESMRVEKWVGNAVNGGAKILAGGNRKGSVYEPTVLVDVDKEMEVVCQEVFGPVVSLMSFEKFSDAVDMVNDSIFGLQAGVFTKDIGHAFEAIKKIDTGGVIINDVPTYRADHMPYGGNKESGIGREGARFAIEEMTNLKMIVFNL
jgi:acyl-CoA reductase-like NAD-dependent aldehyde dehydrogenase